MKKEFSLKLEIEYSPIDFKDMEEMINSVKKDFDEMNFYSQNHYKLTYLGVLEK